MTPADEKAKAMLEKYYGKKFIEVDKLMLLAEDTVKKAIVLRNKTLSGEVIGPAKCRSMGPCACTGSCIPKEVEDVYVAAHEMIMAIYNANK